VIFVIDNTTSIAHPACRNVSSVVVEYNLYHQKRRYRQHEPWLILMVQVPYGGILDGAGGTPVVGGAWFVQPMKTYDTVDAEHVRGCLHYNNGPT
jgi:hypothetical protein